MTVWLDAQLSPRLAKWLGDSFPVHALAVRDVGLRDADDETIYCAAAQAGAVVITKTATKYEMDWCVLHFQKGTLLLYKSTIVCRMIAERFPEVMALPDDEKFRFIAELWDDVTGGEVPDDPAIAVLIEQRLAEYWADPGNVSPWEDVKARILASRGK